MKQFDMQWVKERCTEDADCLVWNCAADRNGVPRYSVKDGGKTKTVQLRRLVWSLRTGKPVPKGIRVTVTCGNKRCLEHLEAIEPGEVIRRTAQRADVRQRRVLAGLKTRQRSKLDMDKARFIRNSDKTCDELGKELGVDGTMVSRVRRGVAWQETCNPFAGLMA